MGVIRDRVGSGDLLPARGQQPEDVSVDAGDGGVLVPDNWHAWCTVDSRDGARKVLVPYDKRETLVTFVNDGVGLEADHTVVELVPGAGDHGIKLISLTFQDPLILYSNGKVTFINGCASEPVTEAGVQSRQVASREVMGSGKVLPAADAVIQLGAHEDLCVYAVLNSLPIGASELLISYPVHGDQVCNTLVLNRKFSFSYLV